MTARSPLSAPFLKIILPTAAGLAIAAYAGINWAVAGIFCAVFTILALLFRERRAGSVFTWLGIMLFFITASKAAESRSSLPMGKHITAIAQIRETPSVTGRWQHTTADIGFYKPSDEPGAPWQKVHERIRLSVDTTYAITQGKQLAFRGWLNPIDTAGSSYGTLMRRRGYHGRMYLTPGNLLKETAHTSKTPSYSASRLHTAAAARLNRLKLSDRSRATVAAMTIGDKRYIDRDLRRSYNLSGGAHLLAVSGLHVGIVFILINILLYLLPSFRRGHIIRNIAAIAAIWLYATAAGLSPSVIRAATMFSFAQLALATSSQRNALNILLGSAVVMLAVNPNYAGEPGFILSYCAVLSIFAFYKPIANILHTRYKAVNVILGVIIVGFTATLGTAPLVSHWFGNFSLTGIIINPAVILTAHIIVLFGVLWIIAPIGVLQPVFSAILDRAAGIQNAVVEWSAMQKWAVFEGYLPAAGAFLCYVLVFLSIIILYSPFDNKTNTPIF